MHEMIGNEEIFVLLKSEPALRLNEHIHFIPRLN